MLRASRSLTVAATTNVGIDKLLRVLDAGWQAIRAQHPELPPVVLAVGPGSRRGRTVCLGQYAPFGWVPAPRPSAKLGELRDRRVKAIARGDLAAALAASAQELLVYAAELSRDSYEVISEVFITDDALLGSPDEVLGTLLPWRRGRIQTLGMPLM